jgi:RecB family exonuclease
MYLQELEDVKDVSPNLWGTVVHLMLEGFFAGLSQYGIDKLQMPLDKLNKQLYISRFNTIINAILNQINSNIIDLSWRTKLENIANEFVDLTLKSESEVTYTEREFKANGFKAILDRVDTDIINDQKALRIIDYKTGTPPTRSNMIEFKDPQLIVESYILEKNGLKVEDLNYWHVKGYSNKAIDVKQIANSSKSKLSFEEVKQQSYEMLESLKDEFSKTNAKFYPYAQGTAKQKELACKYCPYSGICRKFGL